MYDNEIKETASLNQINPNIIRAIISQESAWNMNAIRFEPKYHWLYKPEEFAKNSLISLDTEICTQKMSWGLGQIMGGLAREQGHKGLMAEMLEPSTNIKHIGIRIRMMFKIAKTIEEVFACYNGGPGAERTINGKFRNMDYVDSCMKFYSKLA